MADEAKKDSNNAPLSKNAPAAPAAAAQGTVAPKAAQPASSAQINVASLNLEGGAITEKVPVLVVPPLNESVAKLRTRFESEQTAAVTVYEAQGTATPAMARQLIPCLVIGSIIQNTDVVKLLNILKVLKDEVKGNRVKFIVLSKIKNPAIIKTFESMGCHEYIVEPINERSLSFKMNLHIKALNGIRKKLRKDQLENKSGDTKIKKGTDAAKGDLGDEALNSNSKAKIEEAQENDADCWVFKNNKPKKAGGKWTMRMKGPDPSAGDWVETGKTEDGKPKWRFAEKGEDPKEAAKKKGWEFTGDKPSFNNGEWGFQGEEPELSLVDENGKKEATKLKTDGDGIVLTKDSETALKKAKEQEESDALKKDQKKKSLFEKNKTDSAAPKDAKEKAAGDKLGFTDEDEEEVKKKKAKGLDFADEDDESEVSSEIGPDGKKVPTKTSKEKKEKKTKDGKSIEFADDKDEDETEEKKASGLDFGGDADEVPLNDKSKDGKTDPKKLKKKGGLDFADDSEEEPEFNNPFDVKGRAKTDNKNLNPEFQDSDLEDEKSSTGDAEKKSAKDKGKEDRKKRPEDLAGMAMDFEDEAPEYDDKVTKDKDGKIGGKNNAKTEKTKNSEWQGHDLSPEGKKAKAKAKGKGIDFADEDEEAPADGKDKKSASAKKEKKKDAAGLDFGDVENDEEEDDDSAAAEADSENEDDAELGAGQKNFLKKKKKKKDEDSTWDEDENSQGWSSHKSEEQKKKGWKGKDSEFVDSEEAEDQLVEIDSPKSVLKDMATSTEAGFEYPPEHFGHKDGIWESAGSDPKDKSKEKVYVFVHPEVRAGRLHSLVEISPWWIFRGERPTFLPKKNVWLCKKTKPARFESVKELPPFVRDFLNSIFKAAPGAMAAEAEFAETPAAEAVADKSEKSKKKSQLDFEDDSEAESEAEAKSKSETNDDAESESESESSSESESGSKTKSKLKPKSGFESDLDSESETKSDSETKAKAESKAKSKANLFVDADSDPGSESSPEKAAAAEAEVASAESASQDATAAVEKEKPKNKVVSKAIVPPPPMMAVFISEMLLSSNGDVPKVLGYFGSVLTAGYEGAAVTIFCFHKSAGGENLARVVACSAEHYVYNTDVGFAQKPEFEQALQAKPFYIGEGTHTLCCPVSMPGVAQTAPIGMVMIEAQDSGREFEDQVRYMHSISQCLRGSLLQIQKELKVKVAA